MRTLYPIFRYADAEAAVSWLERAFGFEAHEVSRDPAGAVQHAELTYGTGMIMVGQGKPVTADVPATADDWRVYVAVDDIDAHHARATAAGAVIVQDLRDTEYGSREYSARDPEGHHWSFGTYRP